MLQIKLFDNHIAIDMLKCPRNNTNKEVVERHFIVRGPVFEGAKL